MVVPTDDLADEELTPEQVAAICALELSCCDVVGDSGCVDPDCWRCHSPLSPENLRTLARNLATAATLCRAWRMRDEDPSWRPGCNLKGAATR